MKDAYLLDPGGPPRGEPWVYKADGRVTHIILGHGVAYVIDSISFRAESCDGSTLGSSSDRLGGRGGQRTDVSMS
ncbi:hypothetical protein RHGRI_016071 [Rhododendron griersonianum]|uniref:Uncharacterized protein n=1 Tax=Rhododendron griersonianum TaxID=479676 RepID=A0AAV6JSL1_9ERIC|nr:hypothetical protein RHGRI_016071 [Rhododendron griersonianum]